MAHDISEKSLKLVQSGLTELSNAIDALANRPPDPLPEIKDRSISGNKIDGGVITKFQSTGIKDSSSRLIVLVNDKGIVTDNIDVENLVGNTNALGDLTVSGTITAQRLHVNEFTADVHNERDSSLEFRHSQENSIENKGILWSGLDYTKQFVFKTNPSRFWSSESIDIHKNSSLMFDGITALTKTELGPSVKTSKLQEVGTLKNLQVAGNLTIDEFVFWKSDFNRLGIGTSDPNGLVSVAGVSSEFIIDEDTNGFKIGTWTNNELSLVTDDTTRIHISPQGNITLGTKGSKENKISIHGRVGIGVNNVSTDVLLEVNGPVKIQNKKFDVGSSYPTEGNYNVGDIIWNNSPAPGNFVGWICTTAGSPGQWKTFGPISR